MEIGSYGADTEKDCDNKQPNANDPFNTRTQIELWMSIHNLVRYFFELTP